MLQTETTAPDEGAAGVSLGGGNGSTITEFDGFAQAIAQRYGISVPHAATVLRLLRGEIFA